MSILRRFLRLGREPVRAGSRTRVVDLLAEHGRLAETLAALRAEVATGDARRRADIAALAERLDGLDGELGKLGREQFRATSLLEGQGVTLEELAEAWREYLDQHEREAGAIRPGQAEREAQVRRDLVQGLLPVVDAVDASVRAARRLIGELQAAPSPATSWLARLRGTRPGPPPTAAARGAALESWFQGLQLIEQRLLGLLEREGVRPIPALGQPFDPHRHLAVAVQDDGSTPDGTVVGEELRGYALGDRVLRHAEVVVARRGGSALAAPQGSEQ